MSTPSLKEYVTAAITRHLGEMPPVWSKKQLSDLLRKYDSELSIDSPLVRNLLASLVKDRVIDLKSKGDDVLFSISEDFIINNCEGFLRDVRLNQLKKLS